MFTGGLLSPPCLRRVRRGLTDRESAARSDGGQGTRVPTTIPAAFAQLRSNLEITDLQASTTSTRQENVRDAVAKGMTLVDPRSFLTGSYARSTMIAPLSGADVDIFVVLHPDYHPRFKPLALLEKLQAVLKETYQSTPHIRPDGQAVTIKFTDFKVDVVPSFLRQGGGYLIPDSKADGWISTDPTVHADVMTASNAEHDGGLIPIVKMIKGWNKSADGDLSGLYLELMTREILAGVRITDDPSGVRFVLERGIERVKTKIHDPAGFNNQINPIKTGSLNNAVAHFKAGFDAAREAERAAGQNRIRDAFAMWRNVFGPYFPSYG